MRGILEWRRAVTLICRPPRCKCAVLNLPITIPIKRSNGKTVKVFNVMGLLSVDNAILWVWRELFVSMFAVSKKQAQKIVPEMLAEIEEKMGWTALERILLGGQTRASLCPAPVDTNSRLHSPPHRPGRHWIRW